MASLTEDRVKVGTCDLGDTFVFHFIELEDYRDVPKSHRYEVRAGNHTVLTTPDRDTAYNLANTMCGTTAPVAEVVVEEEAPAAEPSPEPCTCDHRYTRHKGPDGACTYGTADTYCTCKALVP